MLSKLFRRVLFSAILLSMMASSAFALESFKIIDAVADNAGKVFIITGKNEENFEYTTTRLSNPNRLMVDIKNAVLIGQKREITTSSKSIGKVRISQFSVSPNVVRVVFQSDESSNINNVKIKKLSNALAVLFDDGQQENIAVKNAPPTIKLDEITLEDKTAVKSSENITLQNNPNDSSKLIPPEHSKLLLSDAEMLGIQDYKETGNKKSNSGIAKITAIKAYKNQVYLETDDTLKLNKTVYLSNPERMVFDIGNIDTTGQSVKDFYTSDGNTVRMSQFADKTFRMVVEGKNSKDYKTLVSSDGRSLVIGKDNEIDLSELRENDIESRVENIDISDGDGTKTFVTIKFDRPVFYDSEIKNNNINVEMFNIKEISPKEINDLKKSGEFSAVKVEQIKKKKAQTGEDEIIGVRLRLSFDDEKNAKIIKDSKNNKMIIVMEERPEVRKNFNLHNKVKVVIDAGHGGSDPGCRYGGVEEKSITLDIARQLEKELKKYGVNTLLTRESDSTVSLKDRVYISNTQNPDIFVSVHVNSCGKSSVTGIQTHWFTPDSFELSKSVQNSVLRYTNAKERGIFKSRFYVIHHTIAPSVLVEVGFLSNEAERKDLLSKERKEATAKGIAEGIARYLVKKGK